MKDGQNCPRHLVLRLSSQREVHLLKDLIKDTSTPMNKTGEERTRNLLITRLALNRCATTAANQSFKQN